MPKLGEIYDYDFGIRQDNRMQGPHPALVIQTNHLNGVEGYPLTIVVPISTKGNTRSPSHIQIEPTQENGLRDVSFAKCEQIYTVPKSDLGTLRGSVSAQTLYAVKQALRAVLELQ